MLLCLDPTVVQHQSQYILETCVRYKSVDKAFRDREISWREVVNESVK